MLTSQYRSLATVALPAFLLASATAFAASPFKDVPRSHWAYGALQTAVDHGILQGYDNAFHGNRPLTRYQMAVIIKRMLRAIGTQKHGNMGVSNLPAGDLSALRRLVDEFAHELDLLDVKVNEVDDRLASVEDRVDMLEQGSGSGVAKTDVGPFKIEGEIRIRPEYNNNRDFNTQTADSRDFTLLRTTVGLRWQKENVKAFVQLRDSRTMGNEGGGLLANNTTLNTGNVDLHQGYVDYVPGGNSDFNFRLGRQEVNLGDQRLIGALDWTNVARSFDGVLASHTHEANAYRLFGFTLGDATAGQVGFAGADDQELVGFYNTHTYAKKHSVDYYWMNLKDQRAATAADYDTYGFRYLRPLGDNGWDMKWEHAMQNGSVGALDLDSWATAFTLGYTKGGNQKVRYEFEYDLSPGDPGNAGKLETFQNLFPTNHMHYGIADLMSWQNMQAARISRIWAPTKTSKWRVDLWKFKLDDTRDAWRNAGSGVIRAGTAANVSDDLGMELDLRYWWKDQAVKHELGLAKFFAGDYVRQTGAGGTVGDDSEFAYYMATFPF